MIVGLWGLNDHALVRPSICNTSCPRHLLRPHCAFQQPRCLHLLPKHVHLPPQMGRHRGVQAGWSIVSRVLSLVVMVLVSLFVGCSRSDVAWFTWPSWWLFRRFFGQRSENHCAHEETCIKRENKSKGSKGDSENKDADHAPLGLGEEDDD